MIQIGNAPCSWGALEFELEGETFGYEQVLKEISETGYSGTELGDWDFMPTRPDELKAALTQNNLQLLGAFVPIALSDPKAHAPGLERTLKIAKLMYDAGYVKALIVLADENGSLEERTKNAGCISSEMALNDEQWEIYVKGAEQVARSVKEKYGIRAVFHHHCGGYIETPAEIEKLMRLTDPSLLGLCLDTGHYAFGGGNPIEALEKYGKRVWHIHFKDYNPEIGCLANEESYDYFRLVKEGVFCELGKGGVDFPLIVKILKEKGYNGWIVVEQDILPGMGSPKKYALKNRDFIKSFGL